MAEYDIRTDDLTGEQTQQLLRLHLGGMQSNSPAESVFALDLAGLRAADVTVWSAWSGGELAGIGALRELDCHRGEIKSMRTAPQFLRQGVAAAILEHLIDVASVRGYASLSLETGSGAAFEPALSLYRKRGFFPGEAFGDYVRSDFNQFLHLSL